MIRIKIISIGKTKEPWLEQALEEYVKRLQPYAEIQFILVKDDLQLEKKVLKEGFWIGLDSSGKQLSSEQFSTFLQQQGARITFVIGGPDGLPTSLKQNLISLSPLTFTHQMARLILLEQVYRAFEIAKGSKYHK